MNEDLSKCNCAACPFAHGGKPIPDRIVPPRPASSGKPRLVIVGENPRSNDKVKDTAASGALGFFTKQAMKRADVRVPDRDITYVNAVRCWTMHPSKKDIKKATDCCVPRLTFDPSVPTVALGQHALYATRGHREWKKWSGARLDNVYVSNALTEMFAQPHYKTAYGYHIRNVLQPHVPEPKIIIDDSDDMRVALASLIGKEISVDIETAGTNPFYSPIICIGLGTPELVVSVPWHVGSDTQIRASRETQDLVAQVLKDASLLVAHNGAHDFSALESRGFLLAPKRFDTYIAHGIVYPEIAHRLQYAAGTAFSVKAWKGGFVTSADPDAKGLEVYTQRPLTELQMYNGEDVAYCARLAPIMQKKLWECDHDGWAHYKRRNEVNEVLGRMTQAGMPFDEGARAQLDTWINFDAQRFKAKFEEFAGGIDAGSEGSTAAVKDFFFKTLKAPVIAETEAGEPSLSKDILKRYTQEHKGTPIAVAAKLLLKFKLYGKLHSTFTGPGKMQVFDGRIMPSWNVVGTVSGRLSCSDPNLQQMPLTGRKMFRAPPGKVFVEADLSQLEPRIMAQLSQDPGLIEVYTKGLDLYLRVGEALFAVPYAKVEKHQRQIAKMALLASNYGVGAESFQEQLAARAVYVTMPEASQFLTKLKRGFPVMDRWKRGLVQEAQRTSYVTEPFSDWRRYFFTPRDVEAPKCYNWPLQAGGAAIMNEMLLEVAADVRWGEEALVAQIHDAMTLLVPESRAEYWLKRLPEIMSRDLGDVQLVSEAKASRDWYEVK